MQVYPLEVTAQVFPELCPGLPEHRPGWPGGRSGAGTTSGREERETNRTIKGMKERKTE